MKKNYLFTLLLTLLMSVFSFGQTTVFQESFETGNSGTASETCNDNSGDFFTRTDGSDISSAYEVSGQDGSFYFAAMDTDGAPCSMSTQTLIFDDIDISSKSNLTLALLLAEDQPSDGKFDWDGGDLFYIEVDYDNSGTFTKVLQFATSSNSGFNVSAPMQDTDFDGIGDGQSLSAVFSEFTLSLGTGNLVDIRLVFDGLANGDEDIAVDNIRIIDGFVISPSLVITSPTNNQVFPGSTTDVTVNFNYSNFTLSGDNGSEMTDSTGDGYILGSLMKDGVADGTQNIFSSSSLIESITPGSTYVVTAELVDNSGASLSPKVEATATFSIELPCDLVLGDISTTCDALTTGTDTYNGSIAFTGGNTGATYTITAPAGVTVGGDDPSSAASGTITFTGMTEGTDIDVTIVADSTSSCDFSRTLTSPACIPFPVYESFDYTAGTDLIASTLWENNSNSSDEIQVVTGTLANPFSVGQYPDPVGNMVSFDGTGSDSYIEFNDTNSGKLYTSFIFNVTDISAQQANGGYFAILSEASGGFKGRIWLRPDTTDGTKFNIGLSTSANSSATYHTTAHTTGVEIFVVMSFDFTTNEFKTWVDPDPATFEATEPTADITLGDTLSNLGRFGLRQDSGNETPPINFDELRIDTSWAGVTPKTATASTRDNSIEGFATYPNPITDKRFTITSLSSNTKQVSIFNVLGKNVLSKSFSGTKSNIDVSSISSGIYILKVTENGKTATKKLVIR